MRNVRDIREVRDVRDGDARCDGRGLRYARCYDNNEEW